MAAEYGGVVDRVWGPPGTGKTHTLAERVRALVTEHGPASTLISSFSTTAAHEIGSRFTHDAIRPLTQMVGTLHSHAFRAVGHGDIALDPKILKDWNAQNPELRITPDTRRTGGESGTFTSDPALAVTGDDYLGCLDVLRARMVSPDEWPGNIREFDRRWSAWKRDVGAVDFTDLLDGALGRARDGESAPGKPRFLVSDESQDQTPLETALLLEWGVRAERVIIGMDDDQAINAWRGGNPLPLLTLHGPHVTDEVLGVSFRVPDAVRQVAAHWIRRVSVRRDKQYAPRRDDDGRIVMGTVYQVPESVKDAALVKRVERDIDAGLTVAVLATCNYMLTPLLKNLRNAGVPFHNPYRPADRSWNPFGVVEEGGLTTAQRVWHYLRGDWTADDIRAWVGLVKLRDAGLRAHAKRTVETWPAGPVPYGDVEALFADAEAFGWAATPDPDWLAGCLLAAKRDATAYPLMVARQRGYEALREQPRCVVGTIHSVKGAGVDIVYLAPDMSGAAVRGMTNHADRDEVIRQFYVGMTRAKSGLRILAPGGGQHMTGLVPPEWEVMG